MPVAAADLSSEFEARAEQALKRVKDERARIILQMTLASLDAGRLARAQQEIDALPGDDPLKTALKVQDIPRYLAAAAPAVASLDLDHSPPLRVLGARPLHGHIHACAQALGHHVTAATPGNPLYDKLLAIYGIPAFAQKRTTDLPEGDFQLITTGNLSYGTEAEWRAYLGRLTRKLADGGRIFLTLGRRPVPERNYDPAAAFAMFERAGARVSRPDFSVVMDQATALRFCPPAEKPARPPKLRLVKAPKIAADGEAENKVAAHKVEQAQAASAAQPNPPEPQPVAVAPEGSAAASKRGLWTIVAVVLVVAAVAVAAAMVLYLR